MRFDAEFIRTLKDRCRIEDVLGQRLHLKRAGSNFVACCPFHNEKTPSFTVFPGTQSYHCFGCSEGGDVITFVMKNDGLDYPEAVKLLAGMAGLPLPAEDDPAAVGRQRAKKRLSELNLFAARLFRDNLFSPEGEKARNYLYNVRKLSPSTVKHFGLGFAGEHWDKVSGAMLAAGFTEQEILDGFFAGRSAKTGRIYDYFRNRIMFPYFDAKGEVIAFGGRIMGDGEPKYLNTKDTSVFKKGLNLYALNFAKNNKDGTVLLCEGYMDVISLHQAGFTGAIASCGTALTSEQAQSISRYAKRVVICYDSDNAGTQATKRASEILSKLDLEVAVLDHRKMKGAKDPDEFIKIHGSEAFSALLSGSGSHTEYTLSKIISKYDENEPEDKIRIVKEAADFIATLDSKIAREVYSSKIAQKLGLSEKTVTDEVAHRVKKLGRESARRFEYEQIKDISRISDRLNLQAAKNLRAVTAEENLLGVLAAFPEMTEQVSKLIAPEDFVTDLNRNIYEKLVLLSSDGVPEISALAEYFDTAVMSRIYSFKTARQKLSVNDIKEVNGFISVIKEEKNKKINTESMSDDDFLASINAMKNKKQ